MLKDVLNFPGKIIGAIGAAISNIIQRGNRPLRASFLSIKGLINAIVVASLTLLFFKVSNSFGIDDYNETNKNILQIGIFAAALIGMLIAEFGLPMAISSFYDRNAWTVHREAFQTLLRVFFVSLLVMIFANQTGLARFELPLILLKFTAAGALVGLILAHIKESVLKSMYQRRSESINVNLQNVKFENQHTSSFPMMVFKGSNEVVSIVPNQLISAKISKYSTEFNYQNLFGNVNKQLDISNEEVLKELSKYQQFIKVNANSIVNGLAIQKAVADASGYQLQIARESNAWRVDPKFEKLLEKI